MGSVKWPQRRTLVAFAAAVAGLAAAVWLPGRHDTAAAAAAGLFADEFAGDRGTAADPRRWSLHDGHGAWLDGQGRLLATSLMRARQVVTEPYGHAEARVKVRRAPGPWRALGVVGPDDRVPAGRLEPLGGADPLGGEEFHTYAIDWTPETMTWSVDGEPVLRFTPERPGRPFAVTLNLAANGTGPAWMLVDYVRVTGRKTGTDPSTAPTASKPAAPTPAAKAWRAYTAYQAGDLVSYQGVTYRVREAHTALPGWQPTALPALFARI